MAGYQFADRIGTPCPPAIGGSMRQDIDPAFERDHRTPVIRRMREYRPPILCAAFTIAVPMSSGI